MKILLTGASSDTGLKLTKKLIENLNNFDELYLITNSNPIVQKKDLNKLKKDKLDKLFKKKKLLLNLSKTDSRLIEKTKKVCSNSNKIFMSLYKEKLIKRKYEVSR